MSRHGYSEDIDNWDLIRWLGQVASSIRGKRGQQFLQDLLVALDAMPVKELIAYELEKNGEVCALGALGEARNIDMTELDPEEPGDVASAFGIAPCLAREVMYENDEGPLKETAEQRWQRMRRWVIARIKADRRSDDRT